MNDNLTILGAVVAGLLSFLSPCVLPLVPAYLGQLTAVAVAAQGPGATPSRWTAVTHALLYVLGFGLVFTLFGVAAGVAGGALTLYRRPLATVAGAVLVILGLSMAGILRIPVLERTWRPLDAGASQGLTTMRGGMSLAPAQAGLGGRLGSRLVSGRAGYGTSLALGMIFALGWTPCVGPFLGAVLTQSLQADYKLGTAILLLGYTAGLGIPFVLVAAFYDRARGPMRFLVRHGRVVSLVGGLLLAVFGVAMMLDVLWLFSRFAAPA